MENNTIKVEHELSQEEIDKIQKIDVVNKDWNTGQLQYFLDQQLITAIRYFMEEMQRGIEKWKKELLELNEDHKISLTDSLKDEFGTIFLNSIISEIEKRLSEVIIEESKKNFFSSFSNKQLIKLMHYIFYKLQKVNIKWRVEVRKVRQKIDVEMKGYTMLLDDEFGIFDGFARMLVNSVIVELGKRLKKANPENPLKCGDCKSYNLVVGSKEEKTKVKLLLDNVMNGKKEE